MTNRNDHEVPAAKLRERTNPDDLGFESTVEVVPVEGALGQDRALRALEFGLQVNTNGYHVYASGPAGTGRMTAVQSTLARIRAQRPTPPDWCYIYNFDDPDQPRVLTLPPGRGRQLEHDLQRLVDTAKDAIPRAFQSDEYARRKAEVMREFEEKRAELSRQVSEDARSQGFAIEVTPVGIATVPLVEGRAMTKEEFDALPEEERHSLQQRGEQLKDELEQTLRRGRVVDQEAQERVSQLDREVARSAVGPLLDELTQKYADIPDVTDYLEKVRNDVPDHVDDFRQPEVEGREAALAMLLRDDHLIRYRVNLFVDNSHTEGAPVVVEYQPTYYNLFGRIDYRARLGSMVTDLTMIRSGAVHRANGGYLVLQARDALTGLFVWETLKHTLRSGRSQIENLGEHYTAIPSARIRPMPVPVDVKVVLLGPPILYFLLDALDEDFRRLFGVRADFDVDVDRTPERLHQYAGFLSSLAQRENLKPFHKTGAARIIDYASRLAQNQGRLSTRFLEMARLAREANYWASQNGNESVMGQDVDKAITERDYRNRLLEDRLTKAVMDGTVHIDTDGAVPAQINGLSVIDLGEHAFGRPARITARTSAGTRGVLNIERETQLSGRVHSKGVLILAGYMAGKFAQDKPLTLSASLAFEQIYDEVEGDSASSAELYALLSSLSGLPVRQGIAVTGSVNQRGEVQAIGGVNEKIEGFFRICKERGLTGQQGVLIPRDNVRHLMLKDEVVQAVEEGKFHVWAVDNVEQGIELLTGMPAGGRRADGSYPIGTVNYLADRQLRSFADRLKEFGPVALRGGNGETSLREGRQAAKSPGRRGDIGSHARRRQRRFPS